MKEKKFKDICLKGKIVIIGWYSLFISCIILPILGITKIFNDKILNISAIIIFILILILYLYNEFA